MDQKIIKIEYIKINTQDRGFLHIPQYILEKNKKITLDSIMNNVINEILTFRGKKKDLLILYDLFNKILIIIPYRKNIKLKVKL